MRTSTEMPKPNLILSILGALALGLAFLACASTNAAAQTGTASGPKVTVLIYSGRPNPSFNLGSTQVERLRQLLAAARQDTGSEGQSVLPSVLGYNGILIESRGSGLPSAIAVYRNRIEIREGTAKRFVTDGGELEEFLLNTATEAKALDAEQLRFIRGNRPGATY